MDVAEFLKLPVMGILRGISPRRIEPLLGACRDAGLKTVEIAMNTADAAGLLRKAVRDFGKDFTLGAGTILTLEDLKIALEEGASFIVSPVFVPKIVEECVRLKIPVFPGALIPQHIYEAWNAGAAMVKVFPARLFGPGYFTEIRGPFAHIKLMACSGITHENAAAYFQNGANAIALGSGTFRHQWIEEGRFTKITENLKLCLSAAKNRPQ